jgi:hypothetical protein
MSHRSRALFWEFGENGFQLELRAWTTTLQFTKPSNVIESPLAA